MPQARLTVTIPEGIWVADVTRENPAVSIRILAAFAGEDVGVALAEIRAENPATILQAMDEDVTVTDFEILQQYEGTVLVQFETTIPLLLLPVQDSGIPLTMPFTIEDGQAEWEVTAPQDRLSELGSQLEAFGIPFTVEEVTQQFGPDHLLTDRQRTLIERAVEAGYYDTPRRCSLVELAKDLELAKSTCSETLHRAEERIIKHYLETAADASLMTSHP